MSILVDIHKKLGNFVLDVNIEVENEVLALFGASGCGKSTILKCIAGILRPDRGRIILDGKTLFDSEKHINLSPQKRNVGYLFQQYALFPNMTVEQNIACGIHKRKDPEKVARLIEAVDLKGMEKKYPAQLSGGQQQRTALARILISEPDILMLDEPFSALDTHLRYQMEQEVQQVIKKFGKTVLLVSHDMDEVYRISERVAVMKDGKIEQIGRKQDIFLDPGTINGATLTGYRNISAAEAISDHSVFAKDWGAELEVDGNTDGVTHVAVRTEGLVLDGTENFIPCDVLEVIRNSFSSVLMLKPRDGSKNTSFILHIDKVPEGIESGSKVMVSIPKNELKLLKN